MNPDLRDLRCSQQIPGKGVQLWTVWKREKKARGGFFRKLKRQWQLLVLSIPMLIYILIVNDGRDALRGNIGLLPRVFSLESYKSILSDVAVYQAAWISASKTVIITLLNLFWTSMLAYALSRREYVLRKPITILMVLTMYVNAGLIPNYLLISKTVNLSNNYLVYIIPTMPSSPASRCR